MSINNLFSLSGYGRATLEDPLGDLSLLWQQDILGGWGDTDKLQFRGNFSSQGRIDLLDAPGSPMVDVYRLWGSVSKGTTELRVGLQQLNFGAAKIHRPEQWFDTLIPLDPLQQTEGVRAALLRHYFGTNTSIWAWGALTKDWRDGLETRSNQQDYLNLGVRVEVPVLGMESGISVNVRNLNADLDGIDQGRIGADLRYDGFIGAWLEGSGMYDNYWQIPSYAALLTLGTDYTFNIGNGLYIMQETLFGSSAIHELAQLNKVSTVTTVVLSYPLSILDNIRLTYITYYGAESQFGVIWQRTYDYLSWELGAYQLLRHGSTFDPTLSFRISYNI